MMENLSPRRNLSTVILFTILSAALALTIAFFYASLHNLRTTYEHDFDDVNNNLKSMETRQTAYQQQIQTLTKLVIKSLNATDTYINNITNTVTAAQDVIKEDVKEVNELADSQNSLLATQFAGMFTVLVILVSGYHLSQHIRHMHSPVVQRKIMAVLWMTPIYSVTSWLSLVVPLSEPYLAVIREFYESYCVYTFLSFLIAVLGRGDRWAVVDLLEQRADQLSNPDKFMCGLDKCLWNCCNCCRGRRRAIPSNEVELVEHEGKEDKLGKTSVATGKSANSSSPEAMGTSANAYSRSGHLSPISVGSSVSNMDAFREENFPTNSRAKAEAVLDQCQTYAMQFVLLRPVTAIGWLVSNKLVEPKSFLDWSSPQLYITIVTNASIFFAFRGLVKFYHATRTDLEWCNPWPKFLCIKGVVFMTFWQKMTIAIIVNVAYADDFDTQDDANDFVKRAQNFLICLEMLFAATAHCFVFSPDEWAEGYREWEERRRKEQHETRFGDGVALQDFIQDVKLVMASKRRRKKRKKRLNSEEIDEGLSPSSTMSREDEDHLDLALSASSDHSDHSEDAKQSPRRLMIDAVNEETDELGQVGQANGDMENGCSVEREFTIDDDYDVDLAPPASTLETRQRVRADTSDSNFSEDGGDFDSNWARIENFINEHDSPAGSSTRKRSSPPSTKEIV
mmetsp:Transcript_31459/g.63308  ORF Transcript_31459/g.63308 Transcript_31459/m.63308 type:complete len:680 (-) Transcript_31459:43-2082(-)